MQESMLCGYGEKIMQIRALLVKTWFKKKIYI